MNLRLKPEMQKIIIRKQNIFHTVQHGKKTQNNQRDFFIDRKTNMCQNDLEIGDEHFLVTLIFQSCQFNSFVIKVKNSVRRCSEDPANLSWLGNLGADTAGFKNRFYQRNSSFFSTRHHYQLQFLLRRPRPLPAFPKHWFCLAT